MTLRMVLMRTHAFTAARRQSNVANCATLQPENRWSML
jgi:hypothetical protein